MHLKIAAAAGIAAWLACAAPALAAEARPAAKPASRPAAKAAATPAAAVPPAAVAAASAPASVPADAVPEINRVFKNNVAPRFTVLADDLLDADVRAAAEAMQAEHLPRVRALMDRWFIEEMQQPAPQRAFPRMLARLANEFAIWGRDSTGAAQDAALAQALQVPGMCRPAGPKASELVMRLSRLRGLPVEVRQQAIQAERELLARWGQPRQVSDAEPLAAEEALLQVRATSQLPMTPLPPVLAYFYLGEDDATRQDPLLADPPVRCALHQWAGANPAQFRAAMAMQAADLLWLNRRDAAGPASDDDPYPRLASYFGARGVITLHAVVNPQGKFVRAKVAKREVQVPGIRQARAFAFEGVLELASVANARGMDWSAAAPKEAFRTVQREFEWSLAWQ